MSISYSVDIKLGLFYAEENIKHLLTYGAEEGFVYFDDELQKILSIDQAVQKILYSDPDSGNRHVITKYQDTVFFVWFFKSDDNVLIFSVGPARYRWDKDFSNGKRMCLIDFARYIRLMLNACKDITILELSTESDVTEDLVYTYKNCVVAVVNMGLFSQEKTVYTSDGKDIQYFLSMHGDGDKSMQYFLFNAIQNEIHFVDDHTGVLSNRSAQQYYEILEKEYFLSLCAKKDDVIFKIEIVRTGEGYDCVALRPLEPYRMKKGFRNEEERIDVAFYVQRLLELCENFAIHELKTFL